MGRLSVLVLILFGHVVVLPLAEVCCCAYVHPPAIRLSRTTPSRPSRRANHIVAMRSDQVDVYREIAEVDRQLDALAKDMGFMTKLNTRNALFERRQQLVKQTEEPLKKWGVRVLAVAVT
uniref:Uncharacterized protein n=1 Tax=Vitrella brassicaformis TaxID=1169539 RepID=A0A7S1JVX2_9ALVE|mmetsp:Transcript_27330/g.68164  ORF Transcript_27330/g.68164 Transcript_27330/m.68164 type:complete len:120 (+) Transcript_27330:259-618(+)